MQQRIHLFIFFVMILHIMVPTTGEPMPKNDGKSGSTLNTVSLPQTNPLSQSTENADALYKHGTGRGYGDYSLYKHPWRLSDSYIPSRSSKRNFDMIDSAGFGSFSKRNFDMIDGAGFGAFQKRNFDQMDNAGFGAFAKRNFDQMDNAGFGAFAKRNFDQMDNAGFGAFQKKNFDMIDSAGFGSFTKRKPSQKGDRFDGERTKRNFDQIDTAGFGSFF